MAVMRGQTRDANCCCDCSDELAPDVNCSTRLRRRNIFTAADVAADALDDDDHDATYLFTPKHRQSVFTPIIRIQLVTVTPSRLR